MRDINRIEPFLEKVAELWKKYPDYRFGQMISNINFQGRDMFYLEDDDFLIYLENHISSIIRYEKLKSINN